MATKAEKYDKIQKELMDYILSGQIHSTMIGMTIMVDHSDKKEDIKDVEMFVEYVLGLMKRAEKYGKDNVKHTKK